MHLCIKLVIFEWQGVNLNEPLVNEGMSFELCNDKTHANLLRYHFSLPPLPFLTLSFKKTVTMYEEKTLKTFYDYISLPFELNLNHNKSCHLGMSHVPRLKEYATY